MKEFCLRRGCVSQALSLYVGRDYLKAKPLFEILLDMNPADEEALSCFKV